MTTCLPATTITQPRSERPDPASAIPVYDLAWYLSDPSWPEPNLPLLQASLAQTGMELTDRQVVDWRDLLSDRIATMEWNRAVADVRPFLERAEDLALLTKENVLGLLGRSTSK